MFLFIAARTHPIILICSTVELCNNPYLLSVVTIVVVIGKLHNAAFLH